MSCLAASRVGSGLFERICGNAKFEALYNDLFGGTLNSASFDIILMEKTK